MAKMIKIDPDKLRKELCDRGLSHAFVSQDAGHGPGYINDGLRRGVISASFARHLDVVYHIPPDKYVWTEPALDPEPQPEEKKPERVPVLLDYETLYNVMFRAVYATVKKAWAE